MYKEILPKSLDYSAYMEKRIYMILLKLTKQTILSNEKNFQQRICGIKLKAINLTMLK
jgi:hypothetical protein